MSKPFATAPSGDGLAGFCRRLAGGVRPAVLALLGAFVLTACSSSDEEQDTFVSTEVDVLYNLAANRAQNGRWREAARVFDEVERQHPYSVWARRAQLMSAYAHYEANEYDDAILAAERFLSLHPGNASAPYAHYLIALCHYEQIIDIGRDQRVTEQAMNALNEVVRRYPGSDYARDAQVKLDLVLDHLAGKEMEVGRFYLKRRDYLASIGRFRNVVDKYQTTSHVPEALHRLVEAYLALGVAPEAQAVAAVLGYNFPGSKWYRFSYNLLDDLDLTPESGSGDTARQDSGPDSGQNGGQNGGQSSASSEG